MPREEIVVPNREMSYEGYFSVNEVLDIVKRFLDERDYQRIERVHEYKRLPDGVSIEIKGYHERKMTEDDIFEFDTFFYFTSVKDVEQVVNGEKRKTNYGKMSFTFKGILFMDKVYAMKMKKEGIMKYAALFQWLADRYIFTDHVNEIRVLCKREVDDLYEKLVEYFQAQHYRRKI